MTALEAHIANLLETETMLDVPFNAEVAAALCADPTMRAIIDHAARFDWLGEIGDGDKPEARALLTDWRDQ